MSTTEISLMAHLMRRAGMGATRDELEALVEKGYEAVVDDLVHPERFRRAARTSSTRTCTGHSPKSRSPTITRTCCCATIAASARPGHRRPESGSSTWSTRSGR